MSAPILCPGVIRSVQGTSPGPATGITYTVEFSMPSGQTATMANVKPHNSRYPDTIDTVAATVGTAVLAFDIGDVMQVFIFEMFATTECEA